MVPLLQPARPFDVCVVGGGLAGCVAAICLARLGYKIVIVHAESTSDPRIETTTVSLERLFRELGLWTYVRSAFRQTIAQRQVLWHADADTQRSNDAVYFLIDRPTLDASLLKRAAREGAKVISPARVSPPERDREHGWLVRFRAKGGSGHLKARVIVDAAGRHGILGGLRKRIGEPTLALTGSVSGRFGMRGGMFVEAGPTWWLWCVATGRTHGYGIAFADPKGYRYP